MAVARRYRMLEQETDRLVNQLRRLAGDAPSPFQAARRLVRFLGAHPLDGHCQLGFWAPEVAESDVPDDQVWLEILTPNQQIDLQAPQQELGFLRDRLRMARQGDYLWAVVEGMTAGSRESLGSLYWVRYRDRDGRVHTIRDHLAASVPFGVFGPAEYYDVARMYEGRSDAAYFHGLGDQIDSDGCARVGAPRNILQLHVPTASEGGTIASLNRLFQGLSRKIIAGEQLTPYELNYVGYDAVQLLPVEPTIEYEAGERFWNELSSEGEGLEVRLCRPDTTNWGYDIVISASSAVNPVILESRRPDELVDLAATLHTFPDHPIRLILDVVFGHADNQALNLLNRHFFTGPNMYGQDLNYRHPVVRAMMLEMQRRKVNFGADGVRVDGAQDFKYWDAEAQRLFHDDEYLRSMSSEIQEVAGRRYRPWFIFEDGRPWPQEDWELAANYRTVIEQQPECFQWGPLTFAHNTPFRFTFWVSKWWRLQEIAQIGSNWISGCANHDTMRRGSQADATVQINRRLGDTLQKIMDEAYDNPATTMMFYAMLPGVPMDFIHALCRAPWAFVRNTDDQYGVKIGAEEHRVLYWQVDEDSYCKEQFFLRLKALGYTDVEELRRFWDTLASAVAATNYDLEAIVRMLSSVTPSLAGPPLSVPMLKRIARDWMDDLHDYCNVAHHIDRVEQQRATFNLGLREFRRRRPWLMNNLGEGELFTRRTPTNGSVVFYGLRRSPSDDEQILFVANMEGAPAMVIPTRLPIPNLYRDGWRVHLTAPGVELDSPDSPVILHNSQSVLLTRKSIV